MIYNQQKRILGDIAVQRLIYAEPDIDYEQYEEIEKIAEELKILASYHSDIRECGLYIRSIGMIINNITFLSKGDSAKIEAVQNYAKIGNGYAAYPKDNKLVFYSAQPIYGTEDKAAILYTIMDSDKLMQKLEQVHPQAINILASNDFNLQISTRPVTDEMEQSLRNNSRAQQETGIFEEKLDHMDYWIVSAPIRPHGLMLYSCVPKQALTGKLKLLNMFYFLLIALCLVLVFCFVLLMQRIIYRPIDKLLNAFEQLDKGDLDTKIQFSRKNEFGYLYQCFNEMTEDLKLSFQQMCEQAVSLQRSELNQLYLQIHPHFLYNCFFNISNLCNAGEYDKVKQFTKQLGKYYRYITYGEGHVVEFAAEYQHMNNYIEIQKIRFGDRIQTDVQELPDWAKERKMPKIILQPIVENAYKYACERSLGTGYIRVRIQQDQGALVILIEDNGQGLTEQKLAELTARLADRTGLKIEGGLINIQKRLQLYFGENSGLTVRRSALGGMCVTVRIENHKEELYAVSDTAGR